MHVHGTLSGTVRARLSGPVAWTGWVAFGGRLVGAGQCFAEKARSSRYWPGLLRVPR